jgi:hypothetical protein
VIGVFGDPRAAAHARAVLVRAGVPGKRIEVSRLLTGDGIAAEAPGQSFENQPGQPALGRARARIGEAMRSGTCVVSVLARSDEERYFVEAVLRMEQAYRTGCLPAG